MTAFPLDERGGNGARPSRCGPAEIGFGAFASISTSLATAIGQFVGFEP